ncbi:MAG: 4Fe-4S dicluster domain-containing protein, partial [Cyclobacteriaceae bacterium]|nr:4Fe-4S dicluster domain-containing protein [Cyclobacteriaceae bacterium]
RRNFCLKAVSATIGAIGGTGLVAQSCKQSESSGETVSLLSPDGKLVQVDKSALPPVSNVPPVSPDEARKGIPGKHFVMVVDLARCRNARKCISACEHHHQITPDRPYIKVLRMQDNKESAPYWMPKKCFHCDNPPCVKVCPVGATYKRSDGLVLIDNERCIGCRFCMAACPYSARVFNWGEPKAQETHHGYSPETSIPSQIGTVEKCDFCPDMLRQNKVPHCITSCPNGALYFGDRNSDSVTNSSETVRLSTLLREKAAYRYHEELGTEPNVYYLPPTDRLFPFKDAPEGQSS